MSDTDIAEDRGLPWRVAPWGDGSTPTGHANIISDKWGVVIASELLTETAEFIVATANMAPEVDRLHAGRAADPEAVERARKFLWQYDHGEPLSICGVPVKDDGWLVRLSSALLASAASRAAVWADCRETCAKEADRFVRARHGALAVDIRDAIRALEVPNE